MEYRALCYVKMLLLIAAQLDFTKFLSPRCHQGAGLFLYLVTVEVGLDFVTVTLCELP